MITNFSSPTDKQLSRFASLLGDRVTINEPLGPYTTYRVGGDAALFVRVMNVEDLHAISRALAKVKIPVLVIGRGSNMLISDNGFRGVVIALGSFAEGISFPQPDEPPVVMVGSMASLPIVARQTVAHGLSGFEWAVGVPGSIGGAVRMNAGGHGSDMVASLLSVRMFHIGLGLEANISAADLGMRFRGSDISNQHIVLSASLRLSWEDASQGESRITQIVKWRREHQPGGQNAGSVFVNPIASGKTAGGIIDDLGLRGYRIGSAVVSEKHANFIQADEAGSADDVVELMTFVRHRVHEVHGIDLHSEICLVGFSDTVARDAGAQTTRDHGTTTQLENIFGSSGVADSSIELPSFSEQLSDDVLAELKDAFDGDSTPTGGLYVLDNIEHDDQADSLGDHETAQVAELTLRSNEGRIVIIDEELRQPIESDIPVEDLSHSVNIAPTSDDQRIIGRSRFKSRRKEIANRAARNKRRVLIGIVGMIGVVALVLIILASPLIGVRRVDIEGAVHINPELVQSVESSLRGKSLLIVDTQAAERQLEGDPWVETVRITTFLPSRLLIEIVERKPIAWFLGVDNRARIVDAEGKVLAVESGQPTQYLQITGVGPNLAPGASAGTVYRAAAQLAQGLPVELEQKVLNLGAPGPNQLMLTLRSGTLVNFGPPTDMQNKLIALLVLLRRQDSKQIISIDLTDSRTPTVQSK